jgi:hypothetical protein
MQAHAQPSAPSIAEIFQECAETSFASVHDKAPKKHCPDSDAESIPTPLISEVYVRNLPEAIYRTNGVSNLWEPFDVPKDALKRN